MKKNKMMRAASALLVAVLLTTSVISGTFAKYVTSGTATDSARVAKWGVNVLVTGNDAFATAYGADDLATEKGPQATVVSANEENVVAPGTKGALGSVTITGQPEVDVNVKIVSTFELGSGWTLENGDFYCPLTIAGVKGTDYYDNKDGFVNAVKAQFNVDQNVDANVDLASTFDKVAEWSWSFEGHDGYDTYLGNKAATVANPDLTVSLTLEVTVTQIN